MNWRERFSSIRSSDVLFPGSEQAVFSKQGAGAGAGVSTGRVGMLKIRTVDNNKRANGIKENLEFRCMVMVFE